MARSGSFVFPVGTDFHGMVDEGGYFTTNTTQTGVATAAAPVSFSATNPLVTYFNKAAAGGPSLYLDFCTLIATAAGTAATSIQFAVTMDFGLDRYTSGGTDITTSIVNPNGNTTALAASNAKVRVGNITAAAATSLVRMPVGNRWLKTAIPAPGDSMTIKFGGNESITFMGPTAAVVFVTVCVPKIVVPPQASALIHAWFPAQSGASSYLVETGWVER